MTAHHKPTGRIRPGCHRSTLEKAVKAELETVDIIAGPRVADLSNPASGSKQFKCSECGEWIWLSPTTIGLNLKVPVVCMSCAVVKSDKMIEDGHDVSHLRLRNSRIEESRYKP